MGLSKTLIPLVISVFLLVVANKVVSEGDVTSFQYERFSPNSKDLTYQGDAFVPPSSSSARMTKVNASGIPVPQSVGRVVYSPAIRFWDTNRESTFQTTIKFSINPVNNNPGDGLTFFIIPVGSPIPDHSYGGSFGLFDLDTGTAPAVFAVEFDIYYGGDNSWDPKYPHIGIDINSRVSKAVSRFEDSLGEEVTAVINYESNSGTIHVGATYGSKSAELSYTFDLETILPKEVQVGISASTGGSVALHDLHDWYFTSTLIWHKNDTRLQNPYQIA